MRDVHKKRTLRVSYLSPGTWSLNFADFVLGQDSPQAVRAAGTLMMAVFSPAGKKKEKTQFQKEKEPHYVCWACFRRQHWEEFCDEPDLMWRCRRCRERAEGGTSD